MKKKLFTCMAALTVSMMTFSQNNNRVNTNGTTYSHDNNEIRLNVATPLFGLPEINYERYVTDNMGVGLTAAFSVEKKNEMDLRWMLLTYYRVYFGEKKASGFFIEGNMAVVKEYDEYSYHNFAYDATQDAYIETGIVNYSKGLTSFGCGAAFGFKFLTRNGVTGELCLGVGRLFGNSILEAYPRIGVCIGKRF